MDTEDNCVVFLITLESLSILDLVISKGLNISKPLVSDVALSDHYCVFFECDISVYTNGQTKVVSK